MTTITRRTATLVAVGVLGLGGLAVAAPALALAGAGPADPGPSSAGPPTPGMGHGYGMGAGPGDGTCLGQGVTAQQGTLTGAQKTALASMAQQEKLARDLYAQFAARYDAVVFNHVAAAQSRHLATVRTLLQRYGVADPTANQSAGTFTDPAVQAAYDRLLAQGEQSLSAALSAGQQVERAGIDDLKAALDGVTAPDVKQVYLGLIAGSERHLTAFARWANR
jgi:hypothetical protein